MDGAVQRVLAGRLHELPPLNSSVVRIFTSSTFTDTREERNLLMEDVYPRLKDYCRSKYGLEFQVVDMRWGVRDEAADDHLTSVLCLQEILKCQAESVGPNFVTFLGQRHGFRPIPPSIDCQEFQSLKDILLDQQQDTGLLEKWYRLDTNALRPVYVLQSISSQIPYYLSKDDDKRKDAHEQWDKVFFKLRALLHTAAQSASLAEESKKKYFMSVTEEEIEQGVFKAPGDPNIQCLCYIRIIEDMLEHMTHSLAWRFIDVHPNNPSRLDTEAQNLLTSLRDERLVKKLNGVNVFKMNVQWSNDGGINRLSHKAYLDKLRDHFYNTMVHMIDSSCSSAMELSQNTLFVEVHQHLCLARERCAVFQGRDRLLKRIQQRLIMSNGQPIVVQGPSGCGKTSVMAKCAQQISCWFQCKGTPVLVLRFLGTSPASSSIHQTLQSICQQIHYNYMSDKEYPVTESFNEIQMQFSDLLFLAKEDKPLVIVLDSLDQLSAADFAYKLGWLPKSVPPHCYIIVSTLPEEHGILDVLKHRVQADNIVAVPILGEDLSFDILMSWLRDKTRTLTDQQIDTVKEAFHMCGLPLYVKLVYEEVIHWRSYYTKEQAVLSFTIREVIYDLFKRLNKKHGTLLVMHALGYLSASRNGLGENELEDVLSLDDEVLTDVFQYHVPPIRRIPPILWVRIKNDISNYLVTKEADGVRVVFWYHRQFIEAAAAFYLSDEQVSRNLHSLLADYWLGTWHGKKKPFIYSEGQTKKLNLLSSQASEDRKVAAQPLVMCTDRTHRYNLRKLNNQPYHLKNAERIQELKKICLFNYKWLLTKINGASIQEVLNDMDMLPVTDTEVQLLRNVFNLSRSTLRHDPDTLGTEIVGRLLPFAKSYNIYISQIVDECYNEAVASNVIIPKQQCFGAPGGSLKFTLEHPEIPVTEKVLCLSPDCQSLYVMTNSNRMLVWDLHHGEIMKELKLYENNKPEFNVHSISHCRRYLTCACAYQDEQNPVTIIDLQEEEVIHTFHLERCYSKVGFKEAYTVYKVKDKVLAVVINKEASCFAVPSGKLLHNFELCPANLVLSQDDQLVVFHAKGTNQLHMFNLNTYDALGVIELKATPLCMISDKYSEKFYVALTDMASIEVMKVLHRNNALIEVVHDESLDISKAVKNNIKVLHLLLSPDQKMLLITTAENFLLWDIMRKSLIRTFNIPDNVKPSYRVTHFLGQLSPDGTQVIGAYEEYLVIWRIRSGLVQRSIRASSSLKLTKLLVSNDSQIAITSSERNRIIKVWDLKNIEEEAFTPLSLMSACRYQTPAEHSNRIVVRSYNATETRVVDIDKGEIIGQPKAEVETIVPGITADGQYIILRHPNAVNTSALTVWKVDSGELQSEIQVSSLVLMNATTSLNSKYIVTHCETSPTKDVQVKLWDLMTGKVLGQLAVEEGGFAYIYFAHEDKYVVMLKQYPQVEEGKKCKVVICDVETKQCIKTLPDIYKDGLYVIRASEYILAVAEHNNEPVLQLMNLSNLSNVTQLSCHEERPVGRMSFDEAGTKAVDLKLKVFCLTTGSVICRFSDGDKNLIKRNQQTWPKMTACGNYVVWIVIEQAVVKVGQVNTGEVVGKCFIHTTPLSLQVSANKVISVGADDGRIMLLHLIDVYHGDALQIIQSIRCQDKNKDTYDRFQGKEHHYGKARSSMCILL